MKSHLECVEWHDLAPPGTQSYLVLACHSGTQPVQWRKIQHSGWHVHANHAICESFKSKENLWRMAKPAAAAPTLSGVTGSSCDIWPPCKDTQCWRQSLRNGYVSIKCTPPEYTRILPSALCRGHWWHPFQTLPVQHAHDNLTMMFLQRKVVQLFKIKHKTVWNSLWDCRFTGYGNCRQVTGALLTWPKRIALSTVHAWVLPLRPLEYLSTSPISTFTQTLWDLPRTPCRVTWCCCPLSERTEEMRSGTERGTSVFIHFFCVVYHIISPHTRDLCSDTGQKSDSFLVFVWRLCC